MTNREFITLCERHGFIHKKQSYFRCLGDGVFQTIRTNESCYIDPASPYYSNACRRSKRVAVGIYSIYALLPELWFDPRFGAGTIDAQNFIGKRDTIFLGIQHHFEIMEKVGLSYLDGIDSQEKLVQATEKLSEVNPSLKTSQVMCVPYLICGETEKAKHIINKELDNKHFIKWCVETCDNDSERERRHRLLREWQELRECTQSEKVLKNYMRSNMQRNIKLAESYGIDLSGNFYPLGTGDGSVSQSDG